MQACDLEDEWLGGTGKCEWGGQQVSSGLSGRAREDVQFMGLSKGDDGADLGKGTQAVSKTKSGLVG